MNDFKLFNEWYEKSYEKINRDYLESQRRLQQIYQKKILGFVCNFLDFLNHQEVEIVEGKKWYNNEKRMKRGKPPIPQKYHINLKGNLKRYIYKNSLENKGAWEIGCRFWVRGHWMEFRDDCYKNMKGKRAWILPFIKGKGKFIDKGYYIGEKEQQWEKEKILFSVIRKLFSEFKIENHNRIILNGLEIDCYIPDLKIGFEYNGEQHYIYPNAFHKSKEQFERQQQRDIKKNVVALKKGIKLITIKYNEPLTEENILNKLE